MKFMILVGILVLIVGCTTVEDTKDESLVGETQLITVEELETHNAEEDCWIGYEGKVYDLTGADIHPNMAKTFWSHCGTVDSFEIAAKARHSGSSENRVANYGDLVGEIE